PRSVHTRHGRIHRVDGVPVARQRRREESGTAANFENPGTRDQIQVLYPPESRVVTVLVNGGQQPVVGVEGLPVGGSRFEIIADVPLASRCRLHTASRCMSTL